ncbi:hypothetical protein AC249_AIPGENE16325 [Exaiptasia diaphana]|nr:hypothetical protein AC249_AIPGENE16325 [Exaiptasia diaphana]
MGKKKKKHRSTESHLENVIKCEANKITPIPRQKSVEIAEKIVIKLFMWPPSPMGTFGVSSKRTFELVVRPEVINLNYFKVDALKSFNLKGDTSVYFFDGFEVMPIMREDDFSYCTQKFKMSYCEFTNNTDLNRIYMVRNAPSVSENTQDNLRKEGRPANANSRTKEEKRRTAFVDKVGDQFPTITLLDNNKFSCGKINTLNGQFRTGNIKRHLKKCPLLVRERENSITSFFKLKRSLNKNDEDADSSEDESD